MREFGMSDFAFFLAVLRACPEGARLSFDHSEPESFVASFARWAHRDDMTSFEADYYLIDTDLVDAIERAIAAGELELDHHVLITSADGRGLFQGVDDFYDIYLDNEVRRHIPKDSIVE